MRHSLFCCCFCLLLSPMAHAQRVHQVPLDSSTIQGAIDAAAAGDTVLVDPGVYHERISFRGRPLLLLSRAGPALTVIDGGASGTVVTFREDEGADAILDGFTITGGSHPRDAGGIHVYGASPTLRNNIVRDNIGGRRGHGISLVNSAAAWLEGNQISANHSWPDGNGAGGGGGIGVEGAGAVEIRGNRIVDNRVHRYSSGGGINLVNAGSVRIVGNRIEGNQARLSGGGIAIYGSSGAHIENNLIIGNRLSEPGHGGGVQWLVNAGTLAPALIGNTIVANHAQSGSGVHADGFDQHARISNNLVLAPAGMSAIECGDFGDLAPPVVRYNNALSDVDAYAGLCAPALTGGRDGNRSQAPLFVAGSWRLAPGSAGIDAGDGLAVRERADLDGRARVTDGDGDGSAVVDIGALESAAIEIPPQD
ncbi:MAG TPA: right-handed parallel beta-helix repeat-containing protein [Xanthomonadales bacterium]|nr:right-handed parallel beta-helix repeat-containing protein [Xanthomonadales bacterium]